MIKERKGERGGKERGEERREGREGGKEREREGKEGRREREGMMYSFSLTPTENIFLLIILTAKPLQESL